eukprot:CAMPEP_0168516844 /NCGR_PEP_ID=MMETSP0405-20121227/5658_1 /TAXON_ID=498012 /ORGANISM="Trichosphaerium sp, Strain Am-I-7 wt" /LENGTH=215 /DNA_ID=CAMNT_0008536661 /DNA_START=77 /DNA_END=721 /DNA_ORIENTATION=-
MKPIQATTFTTTTTLFPVTDFKQPTQTTETPRRTLKPSRKERRRIQRKEIENAISDANGAPVYILLSQLNAVWQTPSSKNVNVATNLHRIIFHLSIQNAQDIAKKATEEVITIHPDFKRGMGQGQVGTQFCDCYLRARPMKSSRVQLVEFAEHKAQFQQQKPYIQVKPQRRQSVLTTSAEMLYEGAQILVSLHNNSEAMTFQAGAKRRLEVADEY